MQPPANTHITLPQLAQLGAMSTIKAKNAIKRAGIAPDAHVLIGRGFCPTFLATRVVELLKAIAPDTSMTVVGPDGLQKVIRVGATVGQA